MHDLIRMRMDRRHTLPDKSGKELRFGNAQLIGQIAGAHLGMRRAGGSDLFG